MGEGGDGGKTVRGTGQLGADGRGQTHRRAHVRRQEAGEPGQREDTEPRSHRAQEGGGCFRLTHPPETPRNTRAEKKPLDLAVTPPGASAGVTLSAKQCPPLPSPRLGLPPGKSASLLPKPPVRLFPGRALRCLGSQLALFAFALVIASPCKCVYQFLPRLVPDPSPADARGFPSVWVTLTDSRKEDL